MSVVLIKEMSVDFNACEVFSLNYTHQFLDLSSNTLLCICEFGCSRII